MNVIDALITRYAGGALCPMKPSSGVFSGSGGATWDRLLAVLATKNGFFAFESALHFFPLGDNCEGIEIVEWNRYDVWKKHYPGEHLRDTICFAANVFGDQFCADGNGIGRMDAETGEIEEIASNLDEWASAVMEEPDYYLGFHLAHEWQKQNGAIEPGLRLVPKVPFVCGGDFELYNLHLMDTLKSLQVRGELATQIYAMPDGATIQFEIT